MFRKGNSTLVYDMFHVASKQKTYIVWMKL